MDGDNTDSEPTNYPSYAQVLPEPTIRQKIFGKTTTTLGTIATRTTLRIKQIAAHEVNLLPAKEIVAGLKHIIPRASDANEKAEADTRADDKKNTDNNSSPAKEKVFADSVPKQTTPVKAYTDTERELKEKQDTDKERDQKLKKILAESNEVLATANTVFPFSLFPDSVVLDRTKVTITRRNFFFSSEVMSMRIDDILNVTTSVGPFLGSVTLAGRVLSSEDHFTINNFWRKDAVHLKHIIQGYIIARHNNIDCEHLGKEELITTLTRLGHDTNN